jgi:hypothetical protein
VSKKKKLHTKLFAGSISQNNEEGSGSKAEPEVKSVNSMMSK